MWPFAHPASYLQDGSEYQLDPSASKERMSRRWFKSLFGLLGLSFIGLIMWRSFREGTIDLPGPGSIGTAALLTAVGLSAASRSWAALLRGKSDPNRLRAAFLASQLGKYLPGGGLFQVMGQVEFSRDSHVPLRTASVALGAHGVVQVAAAGFVSGFLVLAGGQWWLRFAAASALLVFAVNRRWMNWLVSGLSHHITRLDPSDLPRQDQLLMSLAWCLVPITLAGVAFGGILNGAGVRVSFGVIVPSFALAWLIGYIALPVPAGLGIREAMLVVLLSQPSGVIVAASVAYRMVVLLVELVLAGLVWRRV